MPKIINENKLRMTKKHHVRFEARKPVNELVKVSFETKSGEEISFRAHKKVMEPVEVDFMAKN